MTLAGVHGAPLGREAPPSPNATVHTSVDASSARGGGGFQHRREFYLFLGVAPRSRRGAAPPLFPCGTIAALPLTLSLGAVWESPRHGYRRHLRARSGRQGRRARRRQGSVRRGRADRAELHQDRGLPAASPPASARARTEIFNHSRVAGDNASMPCFGTCGGCSLQHLEPLAQVAVKQRVLEDALWHIARVRPQQLLSPIHGPAWGYRQRARLSVRYVPKKGGVLVDFRERTRSLVADMSTFAVSAATRNFRTARRTLRILVGTFIDPRVAFRRSSWRSATAMDRSRCSS